MGAEIARTLASEVYGLGILSSSGKGEALAKELGGVGVTGSNQSNEDMQKRKADAIINISTAWTFEPSPMFPASAVFRAGLSAFAKIFADQYAADNIRMNNVLPGWIDSLPQTGERRESVPMKRYGTSAEIAAAVAFLASPGAGYITGQNLRVDGGLTRSV